MNLCKTCKHWARTTEALDISYHGGHAGKCGSDKFVWSAKPPTNGLAYWDYDDYAAGFMTGENFGCIHWAKKSKEQ